MRPLSILILFAVVEYVFRTFIDVYRYHELGLFLEYLPLVITASISGVIYKSQILNGPFGWTYLKLLGMSSCGLSVAKTALFIQWYWFIAPEYRDVPGDMLEGIYWVVFFFVIEIIVISLIYIIEILVMKAFQTTLD